MQPSYISLLNQSKTFILLLMGALVEADVYWLCTRDKSLIPSVYSDLHKMNMRCVLELILVKLSIKTLLGHYLWL